MLKFINKKGQKVMELADNGEVKILNEDLKETFVMKDITTKEKEEKKSE